jgi:hypothetical protein
MDPPLCSRKQTPYYGVEVSDTAIEKEVQNSTIGRKSNVDTLLGSTRASFGTLPREQLSITVKCSGTS